MKRYPAEEAYEPEDLGFVLEPGDLMEGGVAGEKAINLDQSHMDDMADAATRAMLEGPRVYRLRGDAAGFSQHLGDRLGGEKRLIEDGSLVETNFLPDDSERVLVWGPGVGAGEERSLEVGGAYAWVERDRLEPVTFTVKHDLQIVPGSMAGVATADELSEEDALLWGQVVEDALAEDARRSMATRSAILDAVTDEDLKAEFLALPEGEREEWLAVKMAELEGGP